MTPTIVEDLIKPVVNKTESKIVTVIETIETKQPVIKTHNETIETTEIKKIGVVVDPKIQVNETIIQTIVTEVTKPLLSNVTKTVETVTYEIHTPKETITVKNETIQGFNVTVVTTQENIITKPKIEVNQTIIEVIESKIEKIVQPSIKNETIVITETTV